MTRVTEFFGTLLGKAVLAGIALLAVWWVVATLMGGKTAKTEAKLGENQTEAAIESGQDAVNTIGDTVGSEAEIDRITRENDDDIRNAEGADAPVADPARDAGHSSLCKRAAYRDRPECVQHAPAE